MTKFLHVLSAVVWLGGAVTLVAVGFLARARVDTPLFDHVVHVVAAAGKRLFVPLTAVVLVTGGLMLWIGALTFEAWVVWGLVGILATGGFGGMALGPLSERSAAELDQVATRSQGFQTGQKLLRFATADCAVLISVIFAMVVKPTWTDKGLLLAMLVFALAGIGFGLSRKTLPGLR